MPNARTAERQGQLPSDLLISPSTHWRIKINTILTRLFLWQKFVILGVFGGLLASVPFALYYIESDKVIDAATLELQGLAPSNALLRTVHLVQLHRGLSALVLAGADTDHSQLATRSKEVENAFATMDSLLAQDVKNAAITDAWKQAKGSWKLLADRVSKRLISEKESFTDHTNLVSELLKANQLLVGHFGISLDPNPDSYYLMDAALVHLPELIEELARISGKGAGLLASNVAAQRDRVAIMAMTDKTNDRFESLITALTRASAANQGLTAILAAPTKSALEAADKAMQLAQAEIVDTEELAFSSAAYLEQFNTAIDAQLALRSTVMAELKQLVIARRSTLMQNEYTVSAGVALLSLLVAFFGYLIARSITVPLHEAIDVARRVAAGDLTSHIEVKTGNETGQLLQALQEMNGSLVKIVSEVRSGTETIATAATQIAAGNLNLSSRTERQASSLEETVSSMEQLTSTVRQNSTNAQQANALAMSASEVAIKGGTVVAQVVSTMGSIKESAAKIADIIGVIDSIAFQTNILALNAAVEAARAGAQGRGFAVVATEVRSLAQRSAGAAKEIKALIGDSANQVELGSKLVAQAGATMDQIVTGIERVTGMMGEITLASQEQIAGIEQISQAMTEMDNATQQNAALVEEAAAAAGSLQDQAVNQAQVVSVFKLDPTHATAPAPIAKAHAAVSAPAGIKRQIRGSPLLRIASDNVQPFKKRLSA